MGAKYTAGQIKATEKYMQDKHVIKLVVTKEKAQQYKQIAQMRGQSLNRFVIECIEEHLRRDVKTERH